MNNIERQILQDYYGTTENVDINDVFTEESNKNGYNVNDLKIAFKNQYPDIEDWSF